ncbi:hydroxylase (plasmid) [Mycolicibacterium arabiense]|uniref:Hydroxylase n=1 Tax=Mycolicibacterium arabiense TaxID=1286181 RepID=A0A7I7RQA0_9MYCO|nr:FAD-dependent monooxygenase [Mycolicibacterium arabiense]MCV7371974.1 FAD-dependent monooxygenase [Mycolicibacterium arabiense]BBY46707.1 hydroxylase [Mycolicibacterium arabiense]
MPENPLHQLDNRPRRQPAPGPFRVAAVLGGSFAGLLAARVLADHAQRVVILEPDTPTGPFARATVPQSRHGHFLQPDGLTLLEGWFPGFTRDARAHGAALAGPGQHRLFLDGVPVEFPDATMLMASRPLLEHEIRRRVTALPNVDVLAARATGLGYRNGAVNAINYRVGSGGESTLEVDLAVDAMGRASRMTRRLEYDGFRVPISQRVPVGLGYTTTLFTRPAEPREPRITCALNQFSASQTAGTETAPAGIALYAIEGNRWQVVTMTYGQNRHATTRDDVRDIAATSPEVFGAAMIGDPVGQAATFYHRASHRRPVTHPDDLPTGLLFIGDSLASLNPLRGEGMWSAAKQAAVLSDYLATTDEPAAQSRRCVRLLESFVDEVWAAELRP